MTQREIQWMTDEEMAEALAASFQRVAEYLGREFNPIVKQATRAIKDFGFTVWLLEQPRYLRPLMRFAYWVERKVFRL